MLCVEAAVQHRDPLNDGVASLLLFCCSQHKLYEVGNYPHMRITVAFRHKEHCVLTPSVCIHLNSSSLCHSLSTALARNSQRKLSPPVWNQSWTLWQNLYLIVHIQDMLLSWKHWLALYCPLEEWGVLPPLGWESTCCSLRLYVCASCDKAGESKMFKIITDVIVYDDWILLSLSH